MTFDSGVSRGSPDSPEPGGSHRGSPDPHEPPQPSPGRGGSPRMGGGSLARVAVTRPAEKADELARLLEARSLEPVIVPLIRIMAPEDAGPLRKAAARLRSDPSHYDLLLFTSSSAVRAFEEMVRTDEARARPAAPQPIIPTVAAIGSATGLAAREAGWTPAIVPDPFVAEAFLDELVFRLGREGSLEGLRVLFPRAERAREVLPEGLRSRGAIVEVVEAYRTVPDLAAGRRLASLATAGEVDVLTFTSASTVRAFLTGAGPSWKAPGGLVVAAIGPITADAAHEQGLVVTVVPKLHTAEGLADAVASWLSGERRSSGDGG